MASGRSVYQKVSYSNAPFNHLKYDITYSDGSMETFGPNRFVPDTGDVEDIGPYGNRVGWFCNNGSYQHEFGNLGGPNLGQPWQPPMVPYIPLPQPHYVPHTLMSPKDIQDMLKMLGPPEGKEACTKCKEEVPVSSLRKYNWSLKDEHKDLERKICQKCHAKAMDKFYDLDKSVETEEILYGSKDKKRDAP